jgi:CheY-like chemotaxis protein
MDAIGQLSGGIAHDFNNQLGIILGYLDFLKRFHLDDKKPRQWVETATKAALRCTDLTRQLLAFSRSQGSEKEVINLNDSLRELENMIARSLTPEVKVEYFLADDLWNTEINAGEFQDVILNLAINARDAMPNGGELLLETSNIYLEEDDAELHHDAEAGNCVQLMLSDTGTGMDKETLEHIFEPFFTTKPKDKGTGLGMAMVYGFSKRYHGHIRVYSEPGVGTTIRLYLPRSGTAKVADTARIDQQSELPTGSEKILIVDDEADLLQLAEQYLSDLGYQTCTAENAAQALKILAENNHIDLLFSDVVMPGGTNGYELAQQATEQNPELRILLTSGFTSKTIDQEILSRFAGRLLSKPYRKAEMARRIRQILDGKQTP